MIRGLKDQKRKMKEGGKPICRYCGKVIENWEPREMIKTRKKNVLYIHRKCIEGSRE